MEINLYETKNGGVYNVVKIPEENTLESIGVFPGAYVKVESHYNFGGPVSISLGSRNIAIGKNLAKQIFVKEASL
ncbi:MAG TPA: ferrous iron transport protein A [Erysipelotrichaceae bacterium]|jgi:Fe2+ transport system protein FeoA|nr:FeoA family protein [Bacillota bacterium]HCY06612.1 ferrous iron transport protein A [Erysipelotrichaceae bacterium]